MPPADGTSLTEAYTSSTESGASPTPSILTASMCASLATAAACGVRLCGAGDLGAWLGSGLIFGHLVASIVSVASQQRALDPAVLDSWRVDGQGTDHIAPKRRIAKGSPFPRVGLTESTPCQWCSERFAFRRSPLSPVRRVHNQTCNDHCPHKQSATE